MKTHEVLVLNKGWIAIGVISLKKAIIMLFSTYKDGTPKAKIIDPSHDFQQFTWADWSKIKPKEGDDVIYAPNESFRIPNVILLSKYDKPPKQKTKFTRRALCRRDNYTCMYCKKKLSGEEWTVDHVIPRSQGGKTTWDNCVIACVECNSFKAGRTPEQAGLKLLCVPKKPPLNVYYKRSPKIVEDWKHFISEMYYETELENDN